MDHGPEEVAAVLAAIRDGAVAWSTAGDLARATELDRGRIDCALAMLWSMGLVETTGGMTEEEAWTFTPLAADGLRVTLEERRGLVSRPYWVGINMASGRDRSESLHVHVPCEGTLVSVDELVDPGPGPAELAEEADEARHWTPRGPFRVDNLPRPTRLLYDDGPPWREMVAPPPPSHASACHICQGRKLDPAEFCLSCRRWGFDGLVAHRAKVAAHLAAERAALSA